MDKLIITLDILLIASMYVLLGLKLRRYGRKPIGKPVEMLPTGYIKTNYRDNFNRGKW
jgi:hypothetical protein